MAKNTAKKKKQPPRSGKKKPPPAKPRVVSHTDDGVPIVNVTTAQIRKGAAVGGGQLVRIPHVAERSRFYAEAAGIIGEREGMALPYHGGRTWRCEVRVYDGDGASGDNRDGDADGKGDDEDENVPKKRKMTFKSPTPLFRWYRGGLVLATLPYILEDVVRVDARMPGKKRWANGLSDDELDSSDEEWDDEKWSVEPSRKMNMEMSALTASAYEDSTHPLPHVSRAWISPDLRRFQSRKSAVAHAETLVERDLLIDRTLYGYGHNGARLRPAKPARKQALEAGMARFLRDGLWVVGQEEMWIERRRDALVRKQERRMQLELGEGAVVEEKAKGDETAAEGLGEEKPVAAPEEKGVRDCGSDVQAAESEDAPAADHHMTAIKAAARAVAGNVQPKLNSPAEQNTLPAAGDPVSDNAHDNQSSIDDSKPSADPTPCDEDMKIVSPMESDASTDTKLDVEPLPEPGNAVIAKRSPCSKGAKPPPPFTPSTHYRLNRDQIDLCYEACVDHYERVMHTVRARSLHHELADGFDVFRERGRGRYDMELDLFDTPAFSFLTDPRRAAWMPIVRKILGDDASLVHKGCFLSLPGSETQVYHQDGVHLNKKVHKPCYAINVFIPLVDCDVSNGPTEFCLGTHYLGYENFVKENAYTPCVTAGTPVIFDYRLGHRGLRNFSQDIRPVVYLTYSSVGSGKEFRDSVNFSRKRYRKLGDFAEMPLSREERARKRRRQEA